MMKPCARAMKEDEKRCFRRARVHGKNDNNNHTDCEYFEPDPNSWVSAVR